MSYTLLKETERTAAKNHRCIWCWTRIVVGSRYIDERSVADGSAAGPYPLPGTKDLN